MPLESIVLILPKYLFVVESVLFSTATVNTFDPDVPAEYIVAFVIGTMFGYHPET